MGKTFQKKLLGINVQIRIISFNLLILTAASSIFAMENEKKELHLSDIPKEVQNLIGSYLEEHIAEQSQLQYEPIMVEDREKSITHDFQYLLTSIDTINTYKPIKPILFSQELAINPLGLFYCPPVSYEQIIVKDWDNISSDTQFQHPLSSKDDTDFDGSRDFYFENPNKENNLRNLPDKTSTKQKQKNALVECFNKLGVCKKILCSESIKNESKQNLKKKNLIEKEQGLNSFKLNPTITKTILKKYIRKKFQS